MKKIVALVITFTIFSSVLFASVGGGYSLAPVGEKASDSNSFGALAISATFSPWVETHIADIEAEVLLSYTSPYFNGVKVKLSSPLFITTKHCFNFLFPNPVYWAPKVAIGGEYRLDNQWALVFSLSPLAFYDTSFAYEFFSPYGLYDFEKKSFGWGLYIMKFSVFFGG